MIERSRYRSTDTREFSPELLELTEQHGALIDWALSYNGYERIGSKLATVLRPLQEEMSTSGKVPEWAGVDLLRGLAFWLVRVATHREAPEFALEDKQFWAVVEALRLHPAARRSDRPPVTG